MKEGASFAMRGQDQRLTRELLGTLSLGRHESETNENQSGDDNDEARSYLHRFDGIVGVLDGVNGDELDGMRQKQLIYNLDFVAISTNRR
jgi:hypothetical protein